MERLVLASTCVWTVHQPALVKEFASCVKIFLEILGTLVVVRQIYVAILDFWTAAIGFFSVKYA